MDYKSLLNGETPRLFDEWQVAPNLWDAIRFEVDNRQEPGQFILTGSTVPPESKDIIHSGIGRIARMQMRTMSLFESEDSSGEVSLQDLFDGKNISGQNPHKLADIAYLTCRGGWPSSLNYDKEYALEQPFLYIKALANTDVSAISNLKKALEKTFTKRNFKSN